MWKVIHLFLHVCLQLLVQCATKQIFIGRICRSSVHNIIVIRHENQWPFLSSWLMVCGQILAETSVHTSIYGTPFFIPSASFSIWAYCLSALVRERDAYAMGFSSPLSILCEMTAPTPKGEASQARMSSLEASKWTSRLSPVRSSLTFLKASQHSMVQHHGTSFSRLFNGATVDDKFLRKLP